MLFVVLACVKAPEGTDCDKSQPIEMLLGPESPPGPLLLTFRHKTERHSQLFQITYNKFGLKSGPHHDCNKVEESWCVEI